MYNHRIISFVAFTGIFWVVEMIIATLIWASLSYYLTGNIAPFNIEKGLFRTKRERESSEPQGTVADPTPTTGSLGIKDEGAPEAPLESYPPAVEADVEDEADGDGAPVLVGGSRAAPSDSGIGTSMESSATRAEAIRRRSSRNMKEET